MELPAWKSYRDEKGLVNNCYTATNICKSFVNNITVDPFINFDNESTRNDVSKGYLYKKISINEKHDPLNLVVRTEVDAYTVT